MKYKHWTLVMAFTGIISASAFPQKTDEITQLMDNKRYASAEELLENIIQSEGAAPELNYMIVNTYLNQDKSEDAKNFIDRYRLDSEKDASPLNRIAYGRFLLQRGEVNTAMEIFNSIAGNKKFRKTPSLMVAMAEAVLSEANGDPAAALTWLKFARDKDDDNPVVYILQGNAYRKIGDGNNAYLSYHQALKKDKKNVNAHYHLGKMFRAQKNTDIYMDHFSKAYAIDSVYAPVLEELYEHYYYVDLKKSRKFLEKYIANSDYNINNEYRMTDILYLTGDYEKAIVSAQSLLHKEKENAPPRLYKLMAYSALKKGDTGTALNNTRLFFEKESPDKLIAPDYELRAVVTAFLQGAEEEAAYYYTMAAEKDTITARKVNYAKEAADLYKKANKQSLYAYWTGQLYNWKENSNNVDLFNWGLAHYMADEYTTADSVFGIYTQRYPADIYGYYWRAQANAALDTSSLLGLAIPHYQQMLEIGEKDKESNKKMLLKAYGYLGGYEANVRKDYRLSLAWFEKYLELDSENEDVIRYAEMLRNWLENSDKE